MENFLLNNNEIESCFRSKPLQYASSYSLEELISKTKELNKYNILLPKNPSIAIIGNSGKLLSQNYGKLIDTHDIVIRCNLAIINNYESYVGSKTNFRIIAGKSFWRDLSDNFSSYKKDFLTNLKNEHFLIKADPLYNAIQGIIKNYNTTCNISYIKQNVINHIQNELNIPDISTGFTALGLALMWSNNVSLFGFGFFEESWDNQHYFENIKPYNRGHDQNLEKQYIEYLTQNNLIKYY